MGALFLTAGAGLVPLSGPLGLPEMPAVWSTLLLAIAGGFVSVDILLGSTSGWVRYMLAQQQVERLRDRFMMDWNVLKVENADTSAAADANRSNARDCLKVIAKDKDDQWMVDYLNDHFAALGGNSRAFREVQARAFAFVKAELDRFRVESGHSVLDRAVRFLRNPLVREKNSARKLGNRYERLAAYFRLYGSK